MHSIQHPVSKYNSLSRNIKQVMSFFVLILTYCTTIYGQSSTDRVSPLQTGHYMPGIMNIRDNADPAPASGLFLLDYNTYQYGDKFYGADGEHRLHILAVLLETH